MRRIVVSLILIFVTLTGLPQDRPAYDPTSVSPPDYMAAYHSPENRDRLLDSIQSYNWDTDFQQWTDNFIDRYLYDGGLNLIKWERKDWKDRGEWVNKFQVFYSFENNLKTEEHVQDWDGNMEDWVNKTLYKFEYDLQGNQIEWLWRKWGDLSEAWINFLKYNYEYDVSGNLIHSQSQMWDASNGTWFYSSNNIYTYNEDGQVSERLYQNYNSVDSIWVTNNRTIYNYESGLETYNESQDWDQTNSCWIPDRRTEFTYDDSENITEILNFKWDDLHVEWKNHSRSINSYNPDGENIESESQTWEDDSSEWQNKSLSNFEYDEYGERILYLYKKWISADQEWENSSKFRYIFKELFSIDEQTSLDPEFCEIPNPIISGQVLNCPKMAIGEQYLIRLYDIQGRMVESKQIMGGNGFSFDVAQLKGIYFIAIWNSQKALYFRKVIVR